MTLENILNMAVDVVPFLIYLAVLIKVWRSWKVIKRSADPVRRHRMAAILGLLSIVTICLLGTNVYTFVMTGKTMLSIRVVQLFLVGNCVVYWVVLDVLTKDSIPEQGRERESAG